MVICQPGCFLHRYYEGKEFETSLKEKRPGDLSPELVEALSIPPLAPPPWLISMQRFGPPPSYPTLRIPGLNAPIPEGAQWGFHPGGWGKPPLDEYNRPLYGDVFGVLPKVSDVNVRTWTVRNYLLFVHVIQNFQIGEPIDKNTWGELEPEEGKRLLLMRQSRYILNNLQKKRRRRKKKKNQKPKKHPRPLLLQMACKHHRVSKRPRVLRLSYRPLRGASRRPISWSSGKQRRRERGRKIQAHGRCTKLFQRSRRLCGDLWEAKEDTMLLPLLERLERLYPSWETSEGQRYAWIGFLVLMTDELGDVAAKGEWRGSFVGCH